MNMAIFANGELEDPMKPTWLVSITSSLLFLCVHDDLRIIGCGIFKMKVTVATPTRQLYNGFVFKEVKSNWTGRNLSQLG